MNLIYVDLTKNRPWKNEILEDFQHRGYACKLFRNSIDSTIYGSITIVDTDVYQKKAPLLSDKHRILQAVRNNSNVYKIQLRFNLDEDILPTVPPPFWRIGSSYKNVAYVTNCLKRMVDELCDLEGERE